MEFQFEENQSAISILQNNGQPQTLYLSTL